MNVIRWTATGLFVLLAATAMMPPRTLAQAQTSSEASRTEAARLATDLRAQLRAAHDNIKRDLGPRAFDVMERSTPRGVETIGVIWGRYLREAGFPDTLDLRQEVARRLIPFGLDNSAATVLVMGPAREEAIEHLLSNLRRVAASAGARDP